MSNPSNEASILELKEKLKGFYAIARSHDSVVGAGYSIEVDGWADAIITLFAHHQLELLQRVEDEAESLTHYHRSLFREGYPGVTEADYRDMFVKEDLVELIKRIRTSIEKGEV